MRSIQELTKDGIKNIKLVTFDTDGVTVPKGTTIIETETHLSIENRVVPDELLKKINELSKYVYVNFSSGRTIIHLDRMYGMVNPTKRILQGENGLFTLYKGEILQGFLFTDDHIRTMGAMKEAIRRVAKSNPNVKGFEPKTFLITVHCYNEVPEIEFIKKFHDRTGEFYILWNGEAYDIGPNGINKGMGLYQLSLAMGITRDEIIAIGNGPNDAEMVRHAGIGVTTDPSDLKADWYTEKGLELGGEELVDKLLELYNA